MLIVNTAFVNACKQSDRLPVLESAPFRPFTPLVEVPESRLSMGKKKCPIKSKTNHRARQSVKETRQEAEVERLEFAILSSRGNKDESIPYAV